MGNLVRGLCAATALVVLSLSAAEAVPLSPEQAKCQKTVAKQGRGFVKKRFKALQSCHTGIYKGKLPASTDCTLNAKADAKIDKAELKLSGKVLDDCPMATMAGMSFGDQCYGVTTPAALSACLISTHGAVADELIATAYPATPQKKCNGGGNDGRYCTVAGNCPAGTCAIPGWLCDGGANDGAICASDASCPAGLCLPDKDHAKCAKGAGGVIAKQADKRMSIVQKCKKLVSAGTLPDGTDCAAWAQVKLDKQTAKSIAKMKKACPDPIAAAEMFSRACGGAGDEDSLAACGTCSGDSAADDLIAVQHGTGTTGGSASVMQISDTNDCVDGPQSRCRVGDYLLANESIRVVVQDIQRNYLAGIGQFGGQIIDADLVRLVGDDRDSFEEWAVSLNIESTAHYTNLTILNDGSNGGAAVLRATGVDDLLDLLNPSSVIADFGFMLPPTVDDFDIPVTVQTDYILEPGSSLVRVETTVLNTDASSLDIFFGEFINGSGQIELFQSGYGFGEPLVTSPCSNPKCNRLGNMVAYSGELDSDGVSYAYVAETLNSSTFTTSGVTVPQLGVDVLSALIGAATANFTLEPNGQDGDSMTFTRLFLVGDGSIGSLVDTRNAVQCVPFGTIDGTVDIGGSPAAGADVTVLSIPILGPGGSGLHNVLSRNVVTHTRADAAGAYSVTVPPGDYNVVANLDGSPFEGGGGTPVQHPVTVAAFGTVTQDVTLPSTGTLQVTVVDENAAPIAARVSVVGFDPSPDPAVTQNILGIISNRTGVFGDQAQDGFPFGIAFATYADDSGDTGDIPLEPGSYRVYVSHGTEYSTDFDDVTITAGGTTIVNGVVEHVIDSTGFVSGDFHVHSIDSPDAAISRVDRVISMLGEGVDFFAATDHGFRADFTSTIAGLGVGHLLTSTIGQEITTFDYGHFNAWPLDVYPLLANGGFIDHGGAAPDGMDYPSASNYSEIPADIIALAHADYSGGSNTVQINHVHSHFGVDGGSGLGIDTGLEPPESTVPAAARRLDPGVTNYFSGTFDALEIWIGDSRGQVLDNFLGQNTGDWFNLLNQGIVSTGVANSDTHRRFTTQSGFPRTMVASLVDDPGVIDQDDVSDSVNAGRAIGTNGPMVRVTVHATSTGDSGGLDVGRCTGVVPCTSTLDCPPCTDDSQCSFGETCTALPTLLTTTDGAVDITVDVQSPTWAQFDKIEFYVNSTTTKNTTPNVQTGAGLIDVNRYSLTPDFVHNDGVEFTVTPEGVPGTSASRLTANTTLSLAGLSEDAWVVVMVSGTDSVSEPLFPVVPNSIAAGPNGTLAALIDGNLGQSGITARAFTNPVFINADGIGGWQAPGVQIAP
jgi:hypothetical protein